MKKGLDIHKMNKKSKLIHTNKKIKGAHRWKKKIKKKFVKKSKKPEA